MPIPVKSLIISWRTIGRDDDLPTVPSNRIERVLKFDQRGFLPSEELDVVDGQ